jgi:hypothetical protein
LAAPLAASWQSGLLHVRLLAEASVPLLRHEWAAPLLGTTAMASSVMRPSKIDRFPDNHAV